MTLKELILLQQSNCKVVTGYLRTSAFFRSAAACNVPNFGSPQVLYNSAQENTLVPAKAMNFNERRIV